MNYIHIFIEYKNTKSLKKIFFQFNIKFISLLKKKIIILLTFFSYHYYYFIIIIFILLLLLILLIHKIKIFKESFFTFINKKYIIEKISKYVLHDIIKALQENENLPVSKINIYIYI